MKPKLYAAEGISNNFKDRDKSVSIFSRVDKEIDIL